MTLFAPEEVIHKIESGVQFKEAELSRLKLESANIDRAVLIDCYMRGSIFIDISCKEANFKNTNLSFGKLANVSGDRANF